LSIGGHGAALIDGRPHAVETLEQPHAVVQPVGKLLGQGDVLDLEVRLARIAGNVERRVRGAEVRGAEAVGVD
jgi:hypothetical protein